MINMATVLSVEGETPSSRIVPDQPVGCADCPVSAGSWRVLLRPGATRRGFGDIKSTSPRRATPSSQNRRAMPLLIETAQSRAVARPGRCRVLRAARELASGKSPLASVATLVSVIPSVVEGSPAW
jgi:hypothetical protein